MDLIPPLTLHRIFVMSDFLKCRTFEIRTAFMRKQLSFAFLFFLFASPLSSQAGNLATSTGIISFRSDAPLEVIKATSEKLHGRIDPVRRTFAFKVLIRSFEGFNSPLQQVHFYENYLESDK